MSEQRQRPRSLATRPSDSALQKAEWLDRAGRKVAATVQMIQEVLTPAGERPFSTAECLLLMKQAEAMQANIWTKELMLVRYKESGPATLVSSYMFFMGQAAATGDYLPPEIMDYKADENGQPISAWIRIRRKSWPEGVYEAYLGEGIPVLFKNVAKFKFDGSLMAQWKQDGPHMFLKVLRSRVIKLAFPEMGKLITQEEAQSSLGDIDSSAMEVDMTERRALLATELRRTSGENGPVAVAWMEAVFGRPIKTVRELSDDEVLVGIDRLREVADGALLESIPTPEQATETVTETVTEQVESELVSEGDGVNPDLATFDRPTAERQIMDLLKEKFGESRGADSWSYAREVTNLPMTTLGELDDSEVQFLGKVLQDLTKEEAAAYTPS